VHTVRRFRRAVAVASLAAATACGAASGCGTGRDAGSDAGRHADGRAGREPPPALRPDDLLVLDMDAGDALPDGGRAGVVLLARADDVDPRQRRLAPAPWASDARWHEPVDLLVLPDRGLLVLEQAWSADGGASRGAVFHVARPGAPPTLCWSDPRTRQLVAMARAPDGTLWVSDRAADPLELGTATGCVFAVRLAADREGALRADEARVAAAGPELITPGALLLASDGRLLLMDADANPKGLRLADGTAATPGVLYELRPDGLATLLQPERTVSPIALIERRPGEIYLVDANAGTADGMLGDGALLRLGEEALVPVLDTAGLGRPRALVDPVGGDVLADGRLVLADANADPLGLGEDGTGKGVYGTGRGALLVADPDARTLDVLLADERFVSPVVVRRVR
jgi:hypothetical protein